MQFAEHIKQHQKTVIAIIISLVLFFSALFFTKLIAVMAPLSTVTSWWLSRLAFWLAILLLLAYSRKIEKRPLMFWQEKSYPLWHYVASVLLTLLLILAAVIVLGIIARIFQLEKGSEEILKIILIFRNHPVLLLLTALTAGITEELMFRAYLIPRLQLLFKNDYIPVILSSVFFGLLHFGYGTVVNMLGPALIGLIFGFHYVKYRNIKILMIAHFLWDYILILLTMRFVLY
jgi:membrane protease YdiL (CAAX protease family)